MADDDAPEVIVDVEREVDVVVTAVRVTDDVGCSCERCLGDVGGACSVY